jgi:hypothetical protein
MRALSRLRLAFPTGRILSPYLLAALGLNHSKRRGCSCVDVTIHYGKSATAHIIHIASDLLNTSGVLKTRRHLRRRRPRPQSQLQSGRRLCRCCRAPGGRLARTSVPTRVCPAATQRRVTRPDIAKRAQPVDAGVGAEIDKNYLATQVHCRQRRRIEPASRPVEARQVTSITKSTMSGVGSMANWSRCRSGGEPRLRRSGSRWRQSRAGRP